MAKVLYITANPKAEKQSYCLSVGRSFLNVYQQINPNDEIIELNLYKCDIPQIDYDVFNGWGKLHQGAAFDELSATEKMKITRINELTEQFASADKYVVATPLWNFSFPQIMKGYIDTICIAGKTFKYTENGPIGLLTGKKAVHIQASGSVYSEGPMKEMEFGDRYLRGVFRFMGVTDFESIIIEGTAQMPDQVVEIMERAILRAQEVAQAFAKESVLELIS